VRHPLKLLYGRRPARRVTLFAPESFGARNTWILNGKNSGFALKQFAILDASMYFACFPESHNSAHSMTLRAVDRTMKPQEMPRSA